MSNLYTTQPNQFNSFSSANGIDVDQAVISQDGMYEIKDYDILSRPTVSGTGILIPAELDDGVPYIPENVGG